jgi:hypothetical protein
MEEWPLDGDGRVTMAMDDELDLEDLAAAARS